MWNQWGASHWYRQARFAARSAWYKCVIQMRIALSWVRIGEGQGAKRMVCSAPQPSGQAVHLHPASARTVLTPTEGMAHEVHNLLTAMAMHALLVQAVLPSESSACADLSAIERLIPRVSDLTNQLLRATRGARMSLEEPDTAGVGTRERVWVLGDTTPRVTGPDGIAGSVVR